MLPVYILHAAALRFSQAVRLRGFQLAEIGERFLGGSYEFLLRGVTENAAGPWVEDLRNGIVILSVGVAGQLPENVLLRLRSQNRALLSDWIGSLPHGSGMDLCDLHLFGSLGAYRAARRRFPELRRAYLTHQADLLLRDGAAAPQDELRAIWPGDPTALEAFPGLAGQVVQPREGARLADVIPFLPGFNLHVVAGPEPPMTPLLPVFAAATCGANVVVSRDRDDAVDYLGGSYPYLAEDGSAEAICAMLDRARAEFGTTVWRQGLERMRNISERTSPGLVASDLTEILERVTQLPRPPRAAA